jgi:pyruvate dehydrogenase E2 component (dihydrolipoamide acetyltransferase)
MIRELILPQLAMGMSEGTIVEWAVAEGAMVQRDKLLVSIETEKVVTELPSPYTGYVHHTAKPGDTLPVEKPIGYIADTEEEYRTLVAGGAKGGHAAQPASPAATAAAAAKGETSATAGGRVRASGLAKAIAKRHALDLSSLTGSGPGGRIVRRDVEAALAAPSTAPSTALAAPAKAALPVVSGGSGAGAGGALREKARIPMTGMRKVIAERMVTAKTTAAHTYAFFEIDVTKLVAARRTMLDKAEVIGSKVSLIALQVKALALACRQVPICNATINGDAISVWDNVNVGIAVALPGKGEYDSGLVVPVVRDAHAKSVLEIDAEVKALVGKARKGELTAAEMADGTITLSSTGGFAAGTWAVSTPLLNLPQVMNFQPGTPVEKPVVVDGQIVVRTMLPCGLSFDHRAMDGEPVGRFVQQLIDLLGHPELMLL